MILKCLKKSYKEIMYLYEERKSLLASNKYSSIIFSIYLEYLEEYSEHSQFIEDAVSNNKIKENVCKEYQSPKILEGLSKLNKTLNNVNLLVKKEVKPGKSQSPEFLKKLTNLEKMIYLITNDDKLADEVSWSIFYQYKQYWFMTNKRHEAIINHVITTFMIDHKKELQSFDLVLKGNETNDK